MKKSIFERNQKLAFILLLHFSVFSFAPYVDHQVLYSRFSCINNFPLYVVCCSLVPMLMDEARGVMYMKSTYKAPLLDALIGAKIVILNIWSWDLYQKYFVFSSKVEWMKVCNYRKLCKHETWTQTKFVSYFYILHTYSFTCSWKYYPWIIWKEIFM